MKIHEYQGKEIFRKYGVPTPRGFPAFSVEFLWSLERPAEVMAEEQYFVYATQLVAQSLPNRCSFVIQQPLLQVMLGMGQHVVAMIQF